MKSIVDEDPHLDQHLKRITKNKLRVRFRYARCLLYLMEKL